MPSMKGLGSSLCGGGFQSVLGGALGPIEMFQNLRKIFEKIFLNLTSTLGSLADSGVSRQHRLYAHSYTFPSSLLWTHTLCVSPATSIWPCAD